MGDVSATTPGGLNVAPGLTLPDDMVTQSFALLAIRGAGKSNGGAVMAEGMYDRGLPFVVIDPKGDYWGLRSSADGTGPGLQVPVFGGLHGDLPLTPESGALVAALIVDQNLTCVLDVSSFPSKAAQMRFLVDFGETLFNLHRMHPHPRHVILEESDEYIPQRVGPDQARCVGVWTKVIKQGRAFGLGATIISQRSAVVNKDALTQVETLIALRTTSAQDRKAILAWVDYHDTGRELVAELPRLLDGEAWWISPQWFPRHGLPAIMKARFRPRRTYDSGRTPTMDMTGQLPATLADIDLSAIADRMAAVTEQAERDDPAALRRRITTLERQVAAGPQDEINRLRTQLADALARPPRTVEVPVIDDATMAAIRKFGADLQEIGAGIMAACAAAGARMHDTYTVINDTMAPIQRLVDESSIGTPGARQLRTRNRARIPATAPAVPASGGTATAPRLGKAERKLLTVLIQHPDGRTKPQLATLSGYSAKSSTFANALGTLRGAGLVHRGRAGDTMIRATATGFELLCDAIEPLPTGPALVDYWMGRLGKAERTQLAAFIDAWPAALTKDDLAERSGYSPTSSTFANALGRLRTLDLVNGWTAAETLALAARETPDAAAPVAAGRSM